MFFRVQATLLVQSLLYTGIQSRPWPNIPNHFSGKGETFTQEARRRSSLEKRSSTSQDFILNHVQDSKGMLAGYLLSIAIGTPAQTVSVRVDTRGIDLWVGGASCNECPDSVSRYESDTSSTSHASDISTDITQYGASTRISGYPGNDIVRIGSSLSILQTPLCVSILLFLRCRRAQLTGLRTVSASQVPSRLLDAPMSGEMGLGFAGISSGAATPFCQTLLDSGQFATREMSFWIARMSGVKNSAKVGKVGGVLTLGGRNSSLFSGEIEFLNLTSGEEGLAPTFWALPLSSISIQSQEVPIRNDVPPVAVIDVGYGKIGGPAADVQAIWESIPGASQLQSQPGKYQFPCRTNVTMSVSFGGRAWNIDPFDINLGPVNPGSSLCIGAIVEWKVYDPPAPNWIFGMAFLKNVYTVLSQDPPSIGFAQLAVSPASQANTSTHGSSSISNPTSSGTTSPTSTSPESEDTSATKFRVGSIVGGVLGGIAGIIFVASIIFLVWRQRRRSHSRHRSHPFPLNLSAAPITDKQVGTRSTETVSSSQVASPVIPQPYGQISTVPRGIFREIFDRIAGPSSRYDSDHRSPVGEEQPTGDATLFNQLESIRNELRRLTADLPHADLPPNYRNIRPSAT